MHFPKLSSDLNTYAWNIGVCIHTYAQKYKNKNNDNSKNILKEFDCDFMLMNMPNSEILIFQIICV